MTIPAGESSLNVYTGTGAADTYDYEFKIEGEADLLVKETDVDGVETTLVLNTDYTVAGVGDDAGGSITLLAGNLTTDHKLTIEDNIEVSQLTPFGNQSAFFAILHENAFDKITRLVRRVFSDSTLHLRIPKAYSEGVSVEYPQPVADLIPRWNATADALENVSAETINGEAAIASYTHEIFLDSTDYTAGVSTQLTLASAPGSKNNTQIYFDGVYVSKDDYEVSALGVITFDAAIPGGTNEVEVVYGQSAGDVGPDHTSIDMIAGVGLTGGGNISADRTFNLDISTLASMAGVDIAATDEYLVNDGGVMKRMPHQSAGNRVVTESGTSRTLTNADGNTYIRCTNASPVTITLNTGVLAKNVEVAIEQAGAGQVTVAGTATVNARNGKKTAGQYAVIYLKCVATSVHTLGGDATT